MADKTLKILSVGNSFSEDTLGHLAGIARSAEVIAYGTAVKFVK